MRILITSTTYWPSLNGQAIFTVNLAERLAARGHDVIVAFPSDRHKPYQSTRNGVRLEHLRSVEILPAIHPNLWMPSPRTCEVRQLFARIQPDILHIQDH